LFLKVFFSSQRINCLPFCFLAGWFIDFNQTQLKTNLSNFPKQHYLPVNEKATEQNQKNQYIVNDGLESLTTFAQH